MKNRLKNITIVILLSGINLLYAGNNPLSPKMESPEKLSIKTASTVSYHSYENRLNFATSFKSDLVQQSINLNARQVTGNFQKEETKGIKNLLQWDFKFKLKLNKNMNIIFSYN